MDNIYILYACDAWKSTSSRAIIMASTNEEDIRQEVIERVTIGCMAYKSDKVELNDQPLNLIDNHLEYGDIVTVENGKSIGTFEGYISAHN